MKTTIFKTTVAFVIAGLFLSACSSSTAVPERRPSAYFLQADLPTRYYARDLADQMMASSHGLRPGQRIAVTSLSWLDSNFDESSLVALQLQEELSTEFQLLAFDVLEFRLTDGIRVTEHGDFAMSRNYLDLPELQYTDYILTGTLVQRREGVMVNVKLVNFDSKVVEATGQVLIPSDIARSIAGNRGVEVVSQN